MPGPPLPVNALVIIGIPPIAETEPKKRLEKKWAAIRPPEPHPPLWEAYWVLLCPDPPPDVIIPDPCHVCVWM